MEQYNIDIIINRVFGEKWNNLTEEQKTNFINRYSNK